MMWRMGKVAGAIDTTVKLIETLIKAAPGFKFKSAAGNEVLIRDLAGLARSIQAATSVPQGHRLEEGAVVSLEKRFAGIESDVRAMLTDLAGVAAKI
jgi:hypothetical protein